jgi:peptidyl-dipeptidase Dcp
MSELIIKSSDNPLLQPFEKTEFGIPPFHAITPGHYKPAFEAAFTEHLNELREIANSNENPTFDNTIKKFDRAGSLLQKVAKVFYNLCSSHCPLDLQKVEMEMAAPFAAHKIATYTLPGLFDRINAVWEKRHGQLSYSNEQLRLIERIHLDFVRAGALIDLI